MLITFTLLQHLLASHSPMSVRQMQCVTVLINNFPSLASSLETPMMACQSEIFRRCRVHHMMNWYKNKNPFFCCTPSPNYPNTWFSWYYCEDHLKDSSSSDPFFSPVLFSLMFPYAKQHLCIFASPWATNLFTRFWVMQMGHLSLSYHHPRYLWDPREVARQAL